MGFELGSVWLQVPCSHGTPIERHLGAGRNADENVCVNRSTGCPHLQGQTGKEAVQGELVGSPLLMLSVEAVVPPRPA